jgi:hypothetical protein
MEFSLVLIIIVNGSTTFVGTSPLFSFLILLYRVDMTPWTGDQLVTTPLPTHRTTQFHIDIHAASRIRTHMLIV